MIKLYDFLPCPFGQKVRIILAEKGLSYELVQIDFTQGEQRKPDFPTRFARRTKAPYVFTSRTL